MNCSGSFGRNTSARLSKLNSSFPGETFRDPVFEKVIISDAFLTQSGKISAIWQKMIGIVAKTNFDVSEETIWEKFLSVENFVALNFLSDFELIFLHFWQESLAGLSELCFYVFDVLFKDFLSKTVFLKNIGIEQKHFRFLAINNGQCCQKNQNPCSKQIEEKKVLEKLTIFFFILSNKNFQYFREKKISSVDETAFN